MILCISNDCIDLNLSVCLLNVAGSVDLEELILAFKELGIDIDKSEATKLLER